MSDCAGIECLAAWEEVSRKDKKPHPYKWCSEKASLQLEEEKLPNAWAFPYVVLRGELTAASAEASAQVLAQLGAVGGAPEISYMQGTPMHQRDVQVMMTYETPQEVKRTRSMPERRHSTGPLIDTKGKLFVDKYGDPWQYTSPRRNALAKFKRLDKTTSPLAQVSSPVLARYQAKEKAL